MTTMADKKYIAVGLIHQVPGRVRFRIPRLAANPALGRRLEQILSQETTILNYRLNAQAASLVIHYSGSAPADWYKDVVEMVQQAASPPIPQQQLGSLNQNSPAPATEAWSNLTLPLLATLVSMASNGLNWPGLRLLATGTVMTAALPVAQRAVKSLGVDRKLNIDCLDLLALILSGWQGKLVTPALVITLHELGDIIRDRTARSTERQTANLLDTIGHLAWVERQGEIRQIPSDEVSLGETVVVYPGERIPVDGVVVQGEAIVDQQQLTGESMPIAARSGTYVYASTLVREGRIRLRSERVGQQTRAAASLELLQKAPVHDTRMANYAAKIADKLIVPSLTLAGIVWGTTQDPARAASILTLDFVTGIRVSMPTAFLGALNHTTRHGILVRSGRTLELLSEIDTVVFDKTGTLTQGNIAIVGIQTLKDGLSGERVLQLAASAEQRLTHPVAAAIAHYAQEQGIAILPRGEWNYEVGLGIRAQIEGDTVLVGSEKFLRQEDIDWSGFDPGHLNPQDEVYQGVARIYVASHGELQGVIQYSDPLRPESPALIQKLQADYGMAVHLLTGDNQQRANQVAQALKIPPQQVHAEAFPEQKAKIVRDLHRLGRTVAYVGDGLNDSVALAYADVSVSFEDGSEIARETADVVLMNNDLTSLLEAISIARETQALIEQNTLLVVAPNLIGLGLASSVGLNPLLATLIHNGTAIAAGLNSLRPLLQHQLSLLYPTNIN